MKCICVVVFKIIKYFCQVVIHVLLITVERCYDALAIACHKIWGCFYNETIWYLNDLQFLKAVVRV